MGWQRVLLTVAAGVFMAASFIPLDASARIRVKVVKRSHIPEALAPFHFCGGRLPGYGFDACGFPEVGYGVGTCWRRLPYRPDQPDPRVVSVCGSSTASE
jgi:hypothetical protein